jgi:uncharacterized damage-inducible protein DinB
MNKSDIQLLYKYNSWANKRILDATANVTTEQFLASASYPHGGLRGTLTHTLFAEWIWRQRWEGLSPTERIKPEDFPTFDSLRARWEAEEKKLMDFIEHITDEALENTITYKNTKGTFMRNVLWHTMVQIINHGTQHRAEAAALLIDFGHSPGDIDLIVFIPEQQ